MQLLRPGRRDAGRYVAHLQTRPNLGRGRAPTLSAATIAQDVAGARALYRALEWAGAADLQPFSRISVRLDPTASIVKNPPYQDELEDVLKARDDRLAALLLLCAHSGLRIGEALAIRRGDVRGQQLTVHGKGGKRRSVSLGRRVRAALADLSPARPPNGYFDWTYAQVSHLMKDTFAAGHAGKWHGFPRAASSCNRSSLCGPHNGTRRSLAPTSGQPEPLCVDTGARPRRPRPLSTIIVLNGTSQRRQDRL
ncbi:integrase [Deinococcus metalli]|uniref:Integrase n=1 Tax=Deinococcus metalli TaxID=1141878 RepID=A0A7W8KIA0_9DEIO|nr:tyrosine-type recombinase/integrase [Deinococcus metalli]MBB5378602.1 integrase [Deinococcus metalli]